MPRRRMPWVRLYVEVVRDRALRRVDAEVRWVWVTILCIAGESPVRGVLLVADGDKEPVVVTAADLQDEAKVRAKAVREGIDYFTQLGWISADGPAGAWRVTGWGRRNFESDNVTARTAKHRAQSNPEPTSLERSNDVPMGVPEAPVGTGASRERATEDREQKAEEQVLGDADAPPVTTKWLDDLPADLPKPVDGEMYAAVLARWIQSQGVEVKWPEGRGDKYTELVRIVCSVVGDDSRDARRCAMRLAFEYLERVDVAVSESMRGHLARLVADLGPGTAFRHLVTAVRQGAGLGDYADRERAVTAYMAGIQRGERQRAQEARA